MIVYSSMSNSVVQTFTPGYLRGRVMSLYLWVFLGTSPLGSLLFGAIEQAWGSRLAMALGGSAAVLAAVGGTWWWSRQSPAQPGLLLETCRRRASPSPHPRRDIHRRRGLSPR